MSSVKDYIQCLVFVVVTFLLVLFTIRGADAYVVGDFVSSEAAIETSYSEISSKVDFKAGSEGIEISDEVLSLVNDYNALVENCDQMRAGMLDTNLRHFVQHRCMESPITVDTENQTISERGPKREAEVKAAI